MSADDRDVLRIVYSASNLLGVNVMSIGRPHWHEILNPDGSPTRLEKAPRPLAGVEKDAVVVAIAASGINNASPGIDVVRHDPKDDPYVYNVDHYTAVETITLHAAYSSFLKQAGVSDSDDLRDTLNRNVYIIKNDPASYGDHWCEELPDRVRNAKPKG